MSNVKFDKLERLIKSHNGNWGRIHPSSNADMVKLRNNRSKRHASN